MKKYSIKTSLVIALASCKDEIEQAPVDLLTVEVVDANFLCCNQEVWLFVANNNGDALDLKELTGEKIDTFSRSVYLSKFCCRSIFRKRNEDNSFGGDGVS
jgi:hypothetical protein